MAIRVPVLAARETFVWWLTDRQMQLLPEKAAGSAIVLQDLPLSCRYLEKYRLSQHSPLHFLWATRFVRPFTRIAVAPDRLRADSGAHRRSSGWRGSVGLRLEQRVQLRRSRAGTLLRRCPYIRSEGRYCETRGAGIAGGTVQLLPCGFLLRLALVRPPQS